MIQSSVLLTWKTNKGQMRNIKEEISAISNIMSIPFPSIGIDIDGCIDEAPLFFSVLAANWPGKIFIISYRDNLDGAKRTLKNFNIRYDELVLVSSFDEKAKVIGENNISVFFDDQPEMLREIAPACNVMLVRNGGNFDFDDKRWMLSNKTGKII